MNRHLLQSSLKSEGSAYVFFFFLFGSHFAYLGKWGLQFLFWFTLGGFGVWGLIELFSIPNRVRDYNGPIYDELDRLERAEKQEHLVTLKALVK